MKKLLKATNPSHRAFSLLECIIALALFSMSAAVLTNAFVNALLARERSYSNEQLNADIRAVRMQLLLEPNLEDAEEGGDLETLNHGEASWNATIEPTNVVDLFRVDWNVEFLSPPEGDPISHAETVYLLRPTWSESNERSELLEDKKQALDDSRNFDRF